MEKENHSAEKKPMREYTPWDYVKPGIAIAAFAVGLIFVLFRSRRWAACSLTR